MANKNMKRYEPKNQHYRMKPVEDIEDKEKSGKERVGEAYVSPFIPINRSFHAVAQTEEKSLPPEYPVFDNDLAVDNIRSDMNLTAADREDFKD